MSQPALFDAIPRARENIPWVPLGTYPTRVHRVDNLVPAGTDLWIKREDEGGVRYGGNKVRKLEFLFGRARAENRSALVTFGQYASHHVAATAIHARHEGFSVRAVLFPQPVDDYVRQMLLVHQSAGAELIPARSVLGVVPTWLRAQGDDATAWLPGGGSDVTGTLGSASAGFELQAQIESGEMPAPNVIYCALGSAGTVAGLLWSLRTERPIEIVAVNAADKLGVQLGRIGPLVRELNAMLGPLLPPGGRRGMAPVLRVERSFCGPLSQPTPASRAATENARALAGLRLEPVYTGKALAALLSDAHAGRLAGKRVLFMHTWNGADLSGLIAAAPGPAEMPAQLRALYRDSEIGQRTPVALQSAR